MNDTKLNLNWIRQLSLIAFAGLVLFYHMIPFTLTPSHLPTADILFCVICILIIRRPEIVPFWIIVVIYLVFDIFQMKPFGVWTGSILISTEILRRNRDSFRENLFLFEWLSASMIFLLALALNRTFLIISLVPNPPITLMLWEFLFTVIAYPIMLFFITYILGVRKPALGEFDIKGQKI